VRDKSEASNARSNRSPDGEGTLRAQGVRTRKMIVRAATRLLLKSGGLDLTLRAVSREAKISVSNLQYYFPDRRELLRAVMAPVIQAYLEDLDRALKSDVGPREIADGIIERAIADAQDTSKMTLAWHFLTLSTVDPECSRLFAEWYGALVQGLANLMQKINPKLGTPASLQFAMLIIAMADGLGLQMWAGRKRAYTRELGASYRTVFNFLLQHNPLALPSTAAEKTK
jgi:AcrR family transcriptional regulator